MRAVPLPEHRMTLTAAPEDIDGLGHVSNLVYLRWVLDVAVAHSDAGGWRWADYQRLGAAWVVRRHEIDYVAPCFAGDVIDARTWVAQWEGASCIRRTRLVRAADGRELCRAATQWVLVTLPGGRPRRIPPELRAAFSAE
jgi:acyl-CoA thioester hydrolase